VVLPARLFYSFIVMIAYSSRYSRMIVLSLKPHGGAKVCNLNSDTSPFWGDFQVGRKV
jgi:hypothetical protein